MRSNEISVPGDVREENEIPVHEDVSEEDIIEGEKFISAPHKTAYYKKETELASSSESSSESALENISPKKRKRKRGHARGTNASLLSPGQRYEQGAIAAQTGTWRIATYVYPPGHPQAGEVCNLQGEDLKQAIQNKSVISKRSFAHRYVEVFDGIFKGQAFHSGDPTQRKGTALKKAKESKIIQSANTFYKTHLNKKQQEASTNVSVSTSEVVAKSGLPEILPLMDDFSSMGQDLTYVFPSIQGASAFFTLNAAAGAGLPATFFSTNPFSSERRLTYVPPLVDQPISAFSMVNTATASSNPETINPEILFLNNDLSVEQVLTHHSSAMGHPIEKTEESTHIPLHTFPRSSSFLNSVLTMRREKGDLEIENSVFKEQIKRLKEKNKDLKIQVYLLQVSLLASQKIKEIILIQSVFRQYKAKKAVTQWKESLKSEATTFMRSLLVKEDYAAMNRVTKLASEKKWRRIQDYQKNPVDTDQPNIVYSKQQFFKIRSHLIDLKIKGTGKLWDSSMEASIDHLMQLSAEGKLRF